MRPVIELEALVCERIQESLDLKLTMLSDRALQRLVVETGAALTQVLKDGKKVLFFGNGGSAADAQHLAAELAGRFKLKRRALPGLALTVNTSCLTAIGNDYSFEQVFARQVESLGVPGDAAIGITTSGRSPNVLSALEAARRIGLVTIALTGQSGGERLQQLSDYCLSIPSNETASIQEAHILTGHILCEIIERGLFCEPCNLS